MRIDSVIEVDAAYFELAEYQSDLSWKVRLPDSNGLSSKGFAQKEALAIVIEIACFLHLAQLIIGSILPICDLIRHNSGADYVVSRRDIQIQCEVGSDIIVESAVLIKTGLCMVLVCKGFTFQAFSCKRTIRLSA